ncbi:class I SAM-dependent methyltransferase [Haloarcula sp. CBA1130]|uniref:class I SAM-dependent methyltransferase n=1 Tax=Haloarcula sp. CBA1130 TaxID=1853685 RepID=UPI001247B363|nr:class I SAM-dependent methyltransferase [Haloarcula sp. CBA1130]KAA9401426.1 class I SAM-dependent methyltransferase [Haloarcula sp. CBA1130]
MGRGDIQFHPVVAALYDPVQWYFERCQVPEHREYLAAGLDGTVLEIGLGTGPMLPYYESEAEATASFHAVEPDPEMWQRAEEKIADSTVEMALVSGRGETLPYGDNTFDYVVECGVCCSVPAIDPMLAEIARVLRPDGEFRFLDHIRSDGWVGRSQDLLTPLWRRIGGNCHLNRRLRPRIRASDHLQLTECTTPTIGIWPIREFARGTATASD